MHYDCYVTGICRISFQFVYKNVYFYVLVYIYIYQWRRKVPKSGGGGGGHTDT